MHRAEVAVAVWSGGVATTRLKAVSALTKPEAERVFGPSGLRPVAEQMRLLRRPSQRGSGNGLLPSGSMPVGVEAGAQPPADDLDEDPKAALLRHLMAAQTQLLEARSSLVMIHGRDSRQDRHITAALQSIGQLRLAANENEL